MSHNAGVKRVLDSMKELLKLYKEKADNSRPMLDGAHYMTDKELSTALGGKILYRESDIEELLQRCYHPAYKMPGD